MNVKEKIQKFKSEFNPLFERTIITILEEQESFNEKSLEIDTQLSKVLLPYSRGGKRIRAFLIHYFSDKDTDNLELQNLCLAMEIFHLMALIHDDIIDQSNMRHGVPTLHYGMKEFEKNNQHLANDIAILYGDLFLAKSFEYTSTLSKEIVKEFSQMISRTVRGQYLDTIGMNYPYGEVPYDELIEKHQLKTSWYTFVSPVRLGIMLSGNQQDIDLVTSALLELGTLFQIRDDIIDCIDSNQGKKMFSDIFENQTTWVTLYLKENYPEQYLKLLNAKDQKNREEIAKVFSEIDMKEVYQKIFADTQDRIAKQIPPTSIHKEKIMSIMELLKLD